ncbi:MAG: FHA domain-containing protein [Gammaproteobacteria bacterium]
MKERRKQERRRWGRKVTYPFIDSEGVLVTKNRRRKIDRRDVTEEDEEAAEEASTSQTSVTANSAQENKKTSLDISASKVMELEEALRDKNEPASSIVESIKDLEEEILDATNIEAVSKDKFDAASEDIIAPDKDSEAKKAPEEKQAAKPAKITKAKVSKQEEAPAELPDIDVAIDEAVNGKDNGMSIELFIKGKKHTVTLDKTSCVVGRDPSCDIVIQNKFVSRAHAKIILKNGKFLVEDNSYNGTYIEFNNGQKIHVSKNEQTLVSSGVMSMGKPVDNKSKSVIEFKLSQ